MSNTQNAQYRFTVKEGPSTESGASDAPLSLMLEPSVGELDVLRTGFLSLRLRSGTSMETAHDIAKQLNVLITGVGFTTL
jgi:hypothetical protein